MKPKHGKRKLRVEEIEIVTEKLQGARDQVKKLEEEKKSLAEDLKTVKGDIEAMVSILADGIEEETQMDLLDYIARKGKLER